MEKFYVTDKVKGSTYNNKEFLKENGFRWDKTGKKWYTDFKINGKLAIELLNLNIATEYDVAEEIEAYLDTVDPELEAISAELPDPEPDAPEDNDRVARPITGGQLRYYTHPYPDEKFNHGAYLNSRAKSKKPIDEWYKSKLVEETPNGVVKFLIGKYLDGGTYAITSIQDYDFNGKQGTSVCVYTVDENNVIIEKGKLRIDTKEWKGKKQ